MTYPFVDLDLATRLERAEGAVGCRFVEARATLDPALGACWQEADGAWAIFDGLGSPLTQSFGLGITTAVRAGTLAAIEAFFQARGAPSEHEVSPLAQGDALSAAGGRGIRAVRADQRHVPSDLRRRRKRLTRRQAFACV